MKKFIKFVLEVNEDNQIVHVPENARYLGAYTSKAPSINSEVKSDMYVNMIFEAEVDAIEKTIAMAFRIHRVGDLVEDYETFYQLLGDLMLYEVNIPDD